MTLDLLSKFNFKIFIGYFGIAKKMGVRVTKNISVINANNLFM
ncbi:MAG: hypothetical protein ACI8ZM_004872 [Crocinitomix sp.]|jgi:hypothetical protein